MKISQRRSLKSIMRSGPAAERKTIRISTAVGCSHEVEAEVLGPLAIHKAWESETNPALFKREGKKLGWVVTHVRTGCAVIGAIACATKKQAKQVMRECAFADVWGFGKFGVKPWLCATLKAHALVRAAGIRADLKLKEMETVERTVPRIVQGKPRGTVRRVR